MVFGSRGLSRSGLNHINWACKLLAGEGMAENEQSGFHEGVTIPVIPVKPVGAGSSIHTDVTVAIAKGGMGGRAMEEWRSCLGCV